LMVGNPRDQRVTGEEFAEYYTNVSASIDDDMYFSQMMNAAWNLQGDASQFRSYGKSWANESEGSFGKRPQTSQGGYVRVNKDPDGQPTLRSGMISSENPFAHMAKYYEGSPQVSATKAKSLANPSLHAPQQEKGKYN